MSSSSDKLPVDKVKVNSLKSPDDKVKVSSMKSPDDKVKVNSMKSSDNKVKVNSLKSPDDKVKVNSMKSPDDKVKVNSMKPPDDEVKVNSIEMISLDSSEDDGDGDNDDILLTFRAATGRERQGRLPLYKVDVECLGPEGLLNDAVIDYWLNYIIRQRRREAEEDKFKKLKRIGLFSSLFYSALHNNLLKNPKKLQAWTQRFDVLRKNFIIIPIPQDCHWLLAVICYPRYLKDMMETSKAAASKKSNALPTSQDFIFKPSTNGLPAKRFHGSGSAINPGSSRDMEGRLSSVDKDFNNNEQIGNGAENVDDNDKIKHSPLILLFDSFQSLEVDREQILDRIRQFLIIELVIKYGGRREDWSQVPIPSFMPSVPQQPNSYDCGIYLIKYFEMFMEDPKAFRQNRLPSLSLENWFEEADVTFKRYDIINTIRHEAGRRRTATSPLMTPSDDGDMETQTSECSKENEIRKIAAEALVELQVECRVQREHPVEHRVVYQERPVEYRGQQERSMEYQGQQERPVEHRGQRERSMEYQGQQERPVEYRGQRERSMEYRGQREHPVEHRGQRERSVQDESKAAICSSLFCFPELMEWDDDP